MAENAQNDHGSADDDAERVRLSRLEAIALVEAAVNEDEPALVAILQGSEDHLELIGSLLGIVAAFATVLPAGALEAVLAEWRRAAVADRSGTTDDA